MSAFGRYEGTDENHEVLAVSMSTLADSFLADLDDLADEEDSAEEFVDNDGDVEVRCHRFCERDAGDGGVLFR